MKKLKVSRLSPNLAVVIAAAAILISVPVRTFQLVSCIDPATGFWAVRDITLPALYIVCAVAVFAMFLVSLIAGTMPRASFSTKRDIPLGISAVLVALSMALDVYTSVMNVLSTVASFEYVESPVRQLVSTGALGAGFEAVFAAFSIIYFIIIAVSKFTSSGAFEKRKILALAPVLWVVCRMLIHFVDPIAYKNVSAIVFELAFLVFALLFLFSFARVAAGVNAQNSMWILFGAGLSASLFGYVSALAPLVVILTGKAAYLCPAYPAHFTDLALALFATLVCYNAMPNTAKVNSQDELVEESVPELSETFADPEEAAKQQRAEEKARKKSEREIAMEAALLQAEASAVETANKPRSERRNTFIQDGPYKADAPIPTVHDEYDEE